jgi:hypothetical protein
MDLKNLLGKLDIIEGTMQGATKHPTGPKFTGQWKGTDAGTPGTKMVGSSEEQQESILKDLSKGPTPKTKEQELSEEFQAFLEAEFQDTVDKRPNRKGARHPRGHEPQPRYKTVKADEAANPAQQAAIAIAMKKAGKKPKNESAMSEKDIELQDYRSMSHKEFQTAYGMTKTEWINKNKSLVIQNPSIKKALGLEEGRAEVDKWAKAMYDEIEERHGWAVAEQFEDIYWAKDVEQIEDARCNSNALQAILRTLKSIGNRDDYAEDWVRLSGLIQEHLGEGSQVDESTDLKKQADKYTELALKANKLGDDEKCKAFQKKVADIKKKMSEQQVDEGAEQDPIVAKVVKQMRPGLTGLDMGNEAFLYFAYELGKQRARDAWEDYLPAIRAEYEKGLAEDGYYGPVEARWMVKLSDDEGDHLKTYHDKFPSLSAAKKAYKNTPYATDFKYKPVKKDKVEEAVDSDIVQPIGQDSFNRAGYNPLRDKNDYSEKINDLIELGKKPGLNKQMQDQIQQRILDLRTAAKAKGFIQDESRGHKILANKLKDIERAKKFATGELKIPTPQERQAQLKQLEKEPKTAEDIVPMANPQATGSVNPVNQQKPDPQDVINAATATNTIKSATQSTAPGTMIAKAIDDASQGQQVGQQDMKALQQTMSVLKTATTDPKTAQRFKDAAQQAKQTQIQQQQKAQQQPKT